MYYATRCLHLPQREPLKLYVVEVKCGEAVSFFPFEKELQSMVWVDELFLSYNPGACFFNDIKNEAVHSAQPLYLYSADSTELFDDTPLVRLK